LSLAPTPLLFELSFSTSHLNPDTDAARKKLAAGGEPSTWFPPGGLVETAGVTYHVLHLRFKPAWSKTLAGLKLCAYPMDRAEVWHAQSYDIILSWKNTTNDFKLVLRVILLSKRQAVSTSHVFCNPTSKHKELSSHATTTASLLCNKPKNAFTIC